MFIPMKELNARKPDIESNYTSIYYLSDNLLAKRFKNLNDRERRLKLKRYEYSKTMKNLKYVSKPIDTLETEKGMCGYIEEIIPGALEGELVAFSDYYNDNNDTITLEDITSFILKSCDIVNSCHEEGIVIPDLVGNLWFNKGNKEVYLTDYQDMQVRDIETMTVSSFIAVDPIIRTSKYYRNFLFTPNLDLYTLTILYLYYTTKLNLPRGRQFNITVDEILPGMGIENTRFAECLRTLYHPDKENMEIREAVEEINKEYVLSKWKAKQPRYFIRK